MLFPKLQLIRLFALVLLLLPLSVAAAADAPETRLQDLAKKRAEREKTFLLRTSDDLGRTLTFANETIALLKEQVETVSGRGPDNKVTGRMGLLEWYQKYVDWLSGMSAEFDIEVSSFFLQQQADRGRTARYAELVKGYQKLADELDRMILKLEGEKKKLEARMQKLNTALLERRVLVDKDDLELARELWPSYRDRTYNRSEALYKDLTDEEVLYLMNELRSHKEQQKYFDSLIELGKYEEAWLFIKDDEFTRLYELARVIGGDAPAPVAYASRGTIRTYEANMAALKRRSGDIDVKLHGVTRTGTLGTLDRLEELSRYYEKMKNRYERHIEWLGAQIGSYQADLIQLGKE